MTSFNSIASTSHRFLRIFAALLLPILSTFFVAYPSYAEHDEDTNQSTEFSQAELDQVLAPIALYPDTVLSQVLIAATYPIEVVQADRWARGHANVKGDDAVNAVEDRDWDPSVKALVAFPDILRRMSDDIDWTQKLGDAFLADEGRVMDSVQNLRKKAYASGSLNKVQHLRVQRDNDEIIIEPAEERVVYVPVYDTRVVYGSWWWPEYPPVYWHYPSHYTHYNHTGYVSSFYWGPSIYIGPTFFYSSFHWSQRQVVVVDYHNHYYDHRYPRRDFYTSRSIVTYEGAHQWRHEPTHRRGVAYYNNRVRENYGSRRESYRDAHVYRDQHRERNSGSRDNYTPTQRQTRFDETHKGNSRVGRSNGINFATPSDKTAEAGRPPIDRAEQLRTRMQRANEVNAAGPHASQNRDRPDGNRQVEDRNVDRNVDRNTARDATKNSDRSVNRQPTPQAAERGNDSIQREHNRGNRDAVREPTAQPRAEQARPVQPVDNDNDRGSRLDRIQRGAANNERREETNNDRSMRVNDSSDRRNEATRAEPREHRERNEGGDRSQRNDSRGEGRSRGEDRVRH